MPSRLPGHTNAELAKAFGEEIEKLKTQDVTDEELQMFKTRTKADLIRGLASNEGLAQQLAVYQTRYGDWRELFRYLDRVDKVNKADIRRVANQAFQDETARSESSRRKTASAPRTGSRRQRSGTAMSQQNNSRLPVIASTYLSSEQLSVCYPLLIAWLFASSRCLGMK